jgi:hypothetical protein
MACGGGGGSGSVAQTARLRVINGSWDVGGSINVVVDGATVVSNIMYPMCVSEVCQALSAYVTVKSGGVDFAVEVTGSTTNLVPQFQKLNLAPNTQNTLIVVGTVGGIPAGGYLFLDDDVPAANSVKLRIADADPSWGGSAWVFPAPGPPAPTGNPTVSNLVSGSTSSYLNLSPGSYVEIFASVPCTPIVPDCFEIGPTTLSANQNVTVYLLNEGFSHRPLILADD